MEKWKEKDIIKTHNNELLEKLKEIVPHVFDDGVLNKEKLLNELIDSDSFERERERERYGFNWIGKNESFSIVNRPSFNTLKPNFEKSINFWDADNLIIEGDNLDVLKIIRNSYHNKIDIIYIDPPYNTGNDFIYNDNFWMSNYDYKVSANLIDNDGIKKTSNQKTDGRFHTNWLNMMFPRLLTARSLLKDDGIIFISIDDNEQSRLKIICDEIFGENNFISCLIWDKRNAQNDNKTVQKNHEYILMYAKNINNFEINFKMSKNKNKGRENPLIVGNEDGYLYRSNKLGWTLYYNESTGDKIPVIDYDYNDVTESSTIDTLYKNDEKLISEGYIPIRPPVKKGLLKRWTWGIEKVKNELHRLIPRKASNGEWTLKIIDNREESPIPHKSILTDFTSTQGTSELSKYQINEFSNSKNVHLIKSLIEKHKNKNAIVLDFFAGSGTTGQAVLDLNKEDGGNRKFILVQLNEKIEKNKFKSIADITQERIKKVIEQNNYSESGFKYFYLSNSNIKKFNPNNQENEINLFNLDVDIFENDATELNIIYEIILKDGLDVNMKLHKIKNSNNSFYIDKYNQYIFAFEKNKYKNLENDIEQIWNSKKHDGCLIIYLRDDNFDDESKLNFSEKISQFNFNNQIIVKVI